MKTTTAPTRAWRRSALVTLLGAAAAGAVLAGCGDSKEAARPAGRTTTTTAAPRHDAASTTTSTAPASFALRDVDWAKAVALDCGTGRAAVPTKVLQVAYATPSPGADVAVVRARCDAGAGTPPTSLLVFDRATGPSSAHLLQTLMDGKPIGSPAAHPPVAGTVSVAGQTLTAEVDAFSSAAVPSCCPDRHDSVTWHWAGGSYQLVPA